MGNELADCRDGVSRVLATRGRPRYKVLSAAQAGEIIASVGVERVSWRLEVATRG